MGRRRTHVPLQVTMAGRPVGRLEKTAGGAVSFAYAQVWLESADACPISLSLPLRTGASRGGAVEAFFDNLLPDRDAVRRRIAERMGAAGSDFYSLLEVIGRDCVGALQLAPEGEDIAAAPRQPAQPLTEADIAAILAGLSVAPLGLGRDQAFRISVAGAQEKTALLWRDGQWWRPLGTTPTTHILKPQLGQIPTADGLIDLSDSVDNEHYCLALMKACGLLAANSSIATFGEHRVLVVERFDRRWENGQLIRLAQEDAAQALGVPPTRKYQSDGGPGLRDILELLRGADDPLADQAAFLKAQMLFWLIGATDGHAKNVSLFLGPGGRFRMTPFYDVLSAQSAFDAGQIPAKSFRLAMSAGRNRHYRVDEIAGRHFVETARAAGMGLPVIRQAIQELVEAAAAAPAQALQQMPAGFAQPVHASISAAIGRRLPLLASALDAP